MTAHLLYKYENNKNRKEGADADLKSWHHFEAGPLATMELLELPFSVPEVAIEALVAEETRPRLTNLGESYLVNLRGINLNDSADPEDMVSIRVWTDGTHIVSTRRRRLKAIDDLRAMFDQNNGPATVSEFMIVLVSRLLARMEPTIEKIEDTIEGLEDHILGDTQALDTPGLLATRRQVVNRP